MKGVSEVFGAVKRGRGWLMLKALVHLDHGAAGVVEHHIHEDHRVAPGAATAFPLALLAVEFLAFFEGAG